MTEKNEKLKMENGELGATDKADNSQLSTLNSQLPRVPRGSRGQFLFVNALTLSRGPLLLLFMAGVLAGIYHPCAWLKWLNLALLVVSSVTDLFDGMLARKWNVTSRLGAVFDPMMDKVFFIIVFPTLTALLFLVSFQASEPICAKLAWEMGVDLHGELPHAILMLVLTVSYILRDQWVMALRALAAGDGADMKANWVGKTRTALSFPIGCMLYCYIAFGWSCAARPLMMGVEIFAIALNLYSFIAYTRRYASALRG